MEEDRLLGKWKVIELSGRWILEEKPSKGKERQGEDGEETEQVTSSGSNAPKPKPLKQQTVISELANSLARRHLHSDDLDDVAAEVLATRAFSELSSDDSDDDSDDSNDDDDDHHPDNSDDDSSDGRAHHQGGRMGESENEEISLLLESNLLEVFVTFKEEGHAEWRMVNNTERKFVNPFDSVKEFTFDEGGELLFINEKGRPSQKLEVAFDAQGRLSLVRDDGRLMILQKILESQTPFTLEGLFQGDRPFSDLKLLSGDGKEIPCHAVIIKARCPKLLEPSEKEFLATTDSSVIQALLHFIYTDTLPENTAEIVKPLQNLAKHLKLERLAMLCEESIQNRAVKNELIQLIGDLSDSVKRIQAVGLQDFVASSAKLTDFLNLLNTEITVMGLKIWVICYLYGLRKEEMTKTEKRELREYSRVKAIDLTKQLNDIFTLISHQINHAGLGPLTPLIDDIRPFVEDQWGFMASVFKDLMAFISQATSLSKPEKKESAFKKIFGTQGGFRMKKIRKEVLKSLGWVVHNFETYQQRTEQQKKEHFQNYVTPLVQELFMNPDVTEEFRSNKVNKTIQNVYNPLIWKRIVKELTAKAVWIMSEAERYKHLVTPIVAKIVEKYPDPNLSAMIQRLGFLQPEARSTPNPVATVPTKPIAGTLNIDFKRFMKSHDLSDMFFVVEGTRIPAHRVIVASGSAHFNHSLQSGMREANEREIILPDVSMGCFDLLLEFFYGGVDLESADVNLVIELLKVCDEYQVSSLKHMCGELLRTHVDVENAVTLLEIADRGQASNLKTAVMGFIVENSEIHQTEEFLALDPRLQEEIKEGSRARLDMFAREMRRSSSEEYQPPTLSSHMEDFSRLQEVMAAMLDIVGPEAEEAEVIRCIRAADFDLNRAINFFWGDN